MNSKRWLFILLLVLPCTTSDVFGQGNSTPIGDDGPATQAVLAFPYACVADNQGNLYISDTGHHRVRKVNLSTGIINTIAGNGQPGFGGDGGPATKAQLNFPTGVALDAIGNLYIADAENQRIRKVELSTGKITTLAGKGQRGYSGDNGPATASKLSVPDAIAIDGKNNVYFADCGNNRIRKVDASTGIITTAAGSGVKGHSGDGGPAKSAKINLSASPVLIGLTIDKNGNLYISGTSNRVRKVTATTGIIGTIAGNGGDGDFKGDGGPATAASFFNTGGIALDEKGNLYVVDQSNLRVRKVDAAGIVTTVVGNGTEGTGGDNGPALQAQLSNPQTLAYDAAGNLYITTQTSVRKVDTKTGIITTVAGRVK